MRRIEAHRIAIAQQRRALTADPAQDGIGQPLEMRLVGALHQAHRGIDGGVRRRAEEQKLRGTQPQDLMAQRIGALQRPLDQQAEDLVDLAQPSQGCGEQQAHEGPVARIEHRKSVVPRQRLVERLALVEAGNQELERGAPGGEKGIHRPAL